MADKKITQLNPLSGAGVATADVLAVADISANETRKVTVADLTVAGLKYVPEGTISGDKLQDDTVDGGKLKKNSVIGGLNGEIALDTITADNIATSAVGADELADLSVDTPAVIDRSITGPKIALNAIDTEHIANNAIGALQIGPNAIETDAIKDGAVTGPKFDAGAFDRGLDIKDDKVGIANAPGAGTQAGISWDDQGLITGASDPIPPEDLPLATETVVGAVSVPADEGLGVSGTGALFINNLVAEATKTKITYDIHGLVTQGADLEPGDLPLATSTTPGAVIVPAIDVDGNTALDIAGDGSVTHSTAGVTPGTYTKVGVNKYGHVITGNTLTASDIPNIGADQIEGGLLDPAVLGPDCIDAENLSDYTTCYMQETQPDGEFLGMLWYTPSTAQLRIYARGSAGTQWLPVGFGALQANNLRWGGSYDASTDKITVVTDIGTSEGIEAGQAFPTSSNAFSGMYFICQTGGNAMTQPDLNSINHTPGDWALCVNETQGWIHIDAGASGGGGGGSASYLNDLLDVNLENLKASELLKFDGDSGAWKNNDVIDGGDF
jgi:hypothetical protein